MTNAEGAKPAITILYTIGLADRTNHQALIEMRDELRQAGYPTELDLRPPSGQFSASIEQILIDISSVEPIVTGALIGLAIEESYKSAKKVLGKLVSRKPPKTQDVAINVTASDGATVNVALTIDADGKQVVNVLAKGPNDIKELPTRPDRPHGHVMEIDENDDLIIKRSDGSGAQRWEPPQ